MRILRAYPQNGWLRCQFCVKFLTVSSFCPGHWEERVMTEGRDSVKVKTQQTWKRLVCIILFKHGSEA
jgi:hypothetical protein